VLRENPAEVMEIVVKVLVWMVCVILLKNLNLVQAAVMEEPVMPQLVLQIANGRKPIFVFVMMQMDIVEEIVYVKIAALRELIVILELVRVKVRVIKSLPPRIVLMDGRFVGQALVVMDLVLDVRRKDLQIALHQVVVINMLINFIVVHRISLDLILKYVGIVALMKEVHVMMELSVRMDDAEIHSVRMIQIVSAERY
jgi:hypothetical protein